LYIEDDDHNDNVDKYDQGNIKGNKKSNLD